MARNYGAYFGSNKVSDVSSRVRLKGTLGITPSFAWPIMTSRFGGLMIMH
jgi:hypothetical protein